MARKITMNQPAPDFTLEDLHGEPVQLSSFRGEKIVLLVFNRGFI
jgi:peroxiredoxin